MLVSIVIPVYNAERFLNATIASVMAQTLEEWELVAVDDGSTDSSPRILRSAADTDSRVRVIQQANAGVAAARNTGLAESSAQTPFVMFLDHDDVLEPHALEVLSEALAAHPDLPAAHGVAFYLDEKGDRSRPGELEAGTRLRHAIADRRLVRVPASAPTTFASMAIFCNLTTPGQAIIRRSALDAVGGFDAAMVPADDWDLWMRMTRLGDLAFVDCEVLGFRAHASNQSGNYGRMDEAMQRVRRKNLEAPDLTNEQRDMLCRGHRYHHRLTARTRLDWAVACLRARRLADAARQLRHAAISLTRSATRP